MSATLRGKDVLEGELTLTLLGVGVANLDINASEMAAGPADLVYAAGGKSVTYSGTIVESAAFGGRTKLRFVLGAGGLTKPIDALGYGKDTPAATVVRDVCAATKEALAEGVDAELRTMLLPTWHRFRGSGNSALKTLAEHLGIGFRTLANGTVWLGKETWPQVPTPFEERGPDANGLAVYAPNIPDLAPGTNLSGKRVSTVVHHFTGSLRSDVTLLKDATQGTDRAKAAQAAFVKQQVPEIDRLGFFEATVISQREDGTLDLKADNEKIGDCPGTPIYHGVPGLSVKVAAKARVKVGFDAASPTGRFAGLWATGAAALEFTMRCPKVTIEADEVYLGEGAARVIREGDRIMMPFGAPGTPTPTPVTFDPTQPDEERSVVRA